MTEKQHVNSCKDIQKRSEFFNSLVIWFSIEWVLGREAWISIAEKISHVQTGSYKHIITELHLIILLLVFGLPLSHFSWRLYQTFTSLYVLSLLEPIPTSNRCIYHFTEKYSRCEFKCLTLKLQFLFLRILFFFFPHQSEKTRWLLFRIK